MMGLTRKGEYAIRGIVFLAQQETEGTVLLTQIAEATHAPATFLAKIFQDFSKAGLVKSYRGTRGGFALARPASQITLREVVETIEGPILPNKCLSGEGACKQDLHCKVHSVWRKVQSEVLTILESVTIEELAS